MHSSFFQLIWVLEPLGTGGWWWDGGGGGDGGDGGFSHFLQHTTCKKSKASAVKNS